MLRSLPHKTPGTRVGEEIKKMYKEIKQKSWKNKTKQTFDHMPTVPISPKVPSQQLNTSFQQLGCTGYKKVHNSELSDPPCPGPLTPRPKIKPSLHGELQGWNGFRLLNTLVWPVSSVVSAVTSAGKRQTCSVTSCVLKDWTSTSVIELTARVWMTKTRVKYGVEFAHSPTLSAFKSVTG